MFLEGFMSNNNLYQEKKKKKEYNIKISASFA